MRFAFLSLAAGTLLAASSGAAFATPQYQTLYLFCKKHDSCDTGAGPTGAMTRDAGGNLYGATGNGSTIFRRTPDGKVTALHEMSLAEGHAPVGSLVMDVNGALYGVAQESGAHGGGTLFRLSPGRKSEWTYTVLYNFCAEANCTDGTWPIGALTYDGARSGALYDGVSPLYGTTHKGGAADEGVAYQIAPKGKNAKYKVIYDFCSKTDCADGAEPQSALLPDGTGSLYGTTPVGGEGGPEAFGTVFKLTPQGKKFGYSVVYSFCKSGTCGDGGGGWPMIWSNDGKLTGVGFVGGAHNRGALYQLSADGSNETVLYSFCDSCDGGAFPNSLVLAADGSFWGTTETDFGRLYRYADGTLTLLHHFCGDQNCADGGGPQGGVVFDAEGAAYGTASSGGWGGNPQGVIYRLTP